MKNDSHINADKFLLEECVKTSLIEILRTYPSIVKRGAWSELANIGKDLISLHERLEEDIGMFNKLSHIRWLVLGMRYSTNGTATSRHFLGVTSKLLRKTGPMVNRLVRKLNLSLKVVLESDRDKFYSDSDIGIINLLSSQDSIALQIAVCVFESVSCGKGVFSGYIWIPDNEIRRLK